MIALIKLVGLLGNFINHYFVVCYADSRPLTEAIVNFPNNLDEITLIAKNDELLIKNYIEDPQSQSELTHTHSHVCRS